MNISDYIQKSNKINSKGCKHNVKIAYLSNITIAGLPEVMNVFCHRDSIFSEFYSAPYNQYAQDIISESSNLYSFEPNIIFIVLDYQSFFGDLFWTPYSFSSELRESIISEKFEEINNLLNTLKSRTNAKIVVNNSVIPTFSSRGIFESKEPKGVRNLIYDFNKKLSDLFASESQIFVYDFLAFAINEGMKKISNEKLHYLADMRISPQSLINLGCQFMGYIYPLLSLTKKCIVLDLDNTLWGGVIGEEGINNINLGPEKEGQPFLDFQKVLLDYFNRGIILAINSKNNLDDAMDVINNHPHLNWISVSKALFSLMMTKLIEIWLSKFILKFG